MYSIKVNKKTLKITITVVCNEIRKTQNNHLSKFDKVCSHEFKVNFFFLEFIPLGF